MYYWIIGGAVVVLAIAGFIIVAFVLERRKEQRVCKDGKSLITAMVMANNSLFDPKGMLPQAAGTVIFGFYAPTPKLRSALQTIATRAFALYEAENLDALSPGCRQFAETIKRHNYTENRRYRVPQEICGSLELYAADVWIDRDRLTKTWSDDRMIACAVTGTAEGEIFHLRLKDPAAIKLYAAVGEA
jgi:hypothetical protein